MTLWLVAQFTRRGLKPESRGRKVRFQSAGSNQDTAYQPRWCGCSSRLTSSLGASHLSDPVGERILRLTLELEQVKRPGRGHASCQRNGPVPELAHLVSA
jgi:hypothetical protein